MDRLPYAPPCMHAWLYVAQAPMASVYMTYQDTDFLLRHDKIRCRVFALCYFVRALVCFHINQQPALFIRSIRLIDLASITDMRSSWSLLY